MAEQPEYDVGEYQEPTEEDASDSPVEHPGELFPPTDEPEEITPEEAAATDIPLEALGPVEEPHLASTVCDVCLELNLTTKTCICCARCGQAFCLHFASTVDAQYCVNCLSDISMAKSTITKTYEHKNDETHTTTFYRRKAREIKIFGLDWLFAQRKITTLTNLELDLAVEYHRNILALMITEYESRRNARIHKYAGVKVAMPPLTKDGSVVTVTTKKTRTVSKTKAQEQLAALVAQMLAKGMTPDMLAALGGVKK